MGRHDHRATAPRVAWYRRAAAAAVRWLGRLAFGALAGAVVLAATRWAGTSWETSRVLGAGAAALVVAAAALAATLPGPPPPGPVRGARPPDGSPDRDL